MKNSQNLEVKRRVPIIDVTDLYHPHQDPGDNFDILAAYGLPEIDLRAVILDCTEPFRRPLAVNPGEGLAEDPTGPRDPGFIPIHQLNFMFGRNVPCAVSPFTRMKSVDDPMHDIPAFQQQGIELILKTLEESSEPVHILSFGSARVIAAAYNRRPDLFREKMACLHLCAGGSSPVYPGYLEWNVALDPLAIVALLKSNLKIAIYPDGGNNDRGKGYGGFHPSFSYDEHNTHYKIPNIRFIEKMDPPLRRYLEFVWNRSSRMDFLRAMESDGEPIKSEILDKEHYVWETALWILVSGRKLVLRKNGSHELIAADAVLDTDKVLTNELRPCTIKIHETGVYEFTETTEPSNFQVYFRGSPVENENALREALPSLYLSFKTTLEPTPWKTTS